LTTYHYLIRFADEAEALAQLALIGRATPAAVTTQPAAQEVEATVLGAPPPGATSARLSDDWSRVIYTVPGEPVTVEQAASFGPDAFPVQLVAAWSPLRFFPGFWIAVLSTGTSIREDVAAMQTTLPNTDADGTLTGPPGPVPFAELEAERGSKAQRLSDCVVSSTFTGARIDSVKAVTPIPAGARYPFTNAEPPP
jgi:hypothetical protein